MMNVTGSKPTRLPYDHNRGPCQVTTEFREKYRNRGGKKADELRNPDNLKNGPQFYKDTAYGQHYKNTKGDPKVKDGFKLDVDLHGRIKESHNGKRLQVDKNHPDRKVGGKKRPDLDLKPSGFEKDKWYGDKIPLNNGNAQREHYGGHYDRFAKRQDERFNNLHAHPNINAHKNTTTARHFVAKERQRDLDRGCNNMNRDYDRTTEQVKPCNRVDKITTYKAKHHPKNGEINSKIHTGQDVIAKKEFGQLMGGYYYDEA
jgi:hypothetical protein